MKTKRKIFPIKIAASLFLALSLIITAYAADTLVPVGHTAGIRLHLSGAVIVDVSELPGNPAMKAGLSAGDVIKKIDGREINSNEEVRDAVKNSGGKTLSLEYEREGKLCKTEITPIKGEDGEYMLGVVIRSSIAGIGTVTYYDPESKTYGALGHAITESDTNVIVPVGDGALMKSAVSDVKKGEKGCPGELCGEYDMSVSFADIEKNSDCGIFGKVSDGDAFRGMKEYPTAKKSEVRKGKAKILANIGGDEVKEYEVEITNIYLDGEKTKNMLIHVTDKELLEKTGGIVRGMSGSPIIQNGKLIGAVTHVLVNDPTRGYGIFIENMLAEAETIK
ncbi:MAG: SpoIVB peptidase [Oscillospiraceae bacterium]|nr:SpoIVB peptidase [Oscillospiraceae bacterium]